MKKTVILVSVPLVFLMVVHSSLAKNNARTKLIVPHLWIKVEQINGRIWVDGFSHPDEKTLWLKGLESGMLLFVKSLMMPFPIMKPISEENQYLIKVAEQTYDTLVLPPGSNVYDIVAQIDMFYSDNANIHIPVIDAYTYSIFKLQGKSKDFLADRITFLRRIYDKSK